MIIYSLSMITLFLNDNLSFSDNIFLIINFISIVEEKPMVSAKLTVDSLPIINFKSIVKEKPSLVPTWL
jgi:hypothetical protein